MFILLSLSWLQMGSICKGMIVWHGQETEFPVFLLRPLPGIWTYDTQMHGMITSDQSQGKRESESEFWDSCSVLNLYIPITLLPTERRCHVTAGVAKQANTSSVLLKWVRWGLATAWPRHWPHIRTCPLWVFAADVWLVWHAATSTILMKETEFKPQSTTNI